MRKREFKKHGSVWLWNINASTGPGKWLDRSRCIPQTVRGGVWGGYHHTRRRRVPNTDRSLARFPRLPPFIRPNQNIQRPGLHLRRAQVSADRSPSLGYNPGFVCRSPGRPPAKSRTAPGRWGSEGNGRSWRELGQPRAGNGHTAKPSRICLPSRLADCHAGPMLTFQSPIRSVSPLLSHATVGEFPYTKCHTHAHELHMVRCNRRVWVQAWRQRASAPRVDHLYSALPYCFTATPVGQIEYAD